MRPAQLWPAAVIGVLALTVGANVLLISLANGPGRAIAEPDYYRKALAWDSTLAQEGRNQALSWRMDAELTGSGPGATLRVRLRDAAGAPVPCARVEVEAIHNRESRPVRARLVANGGGIHRATLPISRRGLWQLRLEARRGSDRYTTVLRRELSPGPP